MCAFHPKEDLVQRILQHVAKCHSAGISSSIDLTHTTEFIPKDIEAHVRYCYEQGWLEGSGPHRGRDYVIPTMDGMGLTETGTQRCG